MPRPCRPRPCTSSQGHGTAWPSREGLWANSPRSASSGYHAEFQEVIRRIPISDAGGQCETKHRLSGFIRDEEKSGSSTLQKRRSVGLAVGYFRLPCGHSRRTRHCRSRAGARRGKCELTHGIAGERHGRGMLCANRPLMYKHRLNVELLLLLLLLLLMMMMMVVLLASNTIWNPLLVGKHQQAQREFCLLETVEWARKLISRPITDDNNSQSHTEMFS